MVTRSESQLLVSVRDLKKHFVLAAMASFGRHEVVRAVDGVTFDIPEGDTFGLVGESGCGKTTLGRCLIRLIELTAGKVLFDGTNLLQLRGQEMRRMRRQMQIVFQDPQTSMNPRMLVRDIVSEPLRIHRLANGKELENRVLDLLERVGLGREHLRRYPHELSGGQKQRVCIARALALNPRFIVLDEPTSALDVSVQARILNLLKDLQEQFGLTYLFISHDLSVVKHMSKRIAVMYLGKIVESGSVSQVFNRPLHPYTRALLSAIPVADPKMRQEEMVLEGDVPSPTRIPSGCRFHTRCPFADRECLEEEPHLSELYEHGHFVACHRVAAIIADQQGPVSSEGQ